jgi:prepilin-type N-terminal cleavage/methylation domain-containing protein
MKGFSNKEGFTFIELMVALGIFTVLIAATYSVLYLGDSTTRDGLAYIELSQGIRLGVDRMTKELRNARRSTISIPEDSSYITFKVPGNSNTIQYSLGGIGGKQLIRAEDGVDTILCNNVQSISFNPSPFSGNIIFITLQSQKTSSSRRDLTASLNLNVKVRN